MKSFIVFGPLLLLLVAHRCVRENSQSIPSQECLDSAIEMQYQLPIYVNTILNFTKTSQQYRSVCPNSTNSVWYRWTPPRYYGSPTQLLDMSAVFVNQTSRPIRITMYEVPGYKCSYDGDVATKVLDNVRSPILRYRTKDFYSYFFQVTTSPCRNPLLSLSPCLHHQIIVRNLLSLWIRSPVQQ
jgi:hypothetical protein